jgi:pimeloyl-ACP methyl ester carboxylesterase
MDDAISRPRTVFELWRFGDKELEVLRAGPTSESVPVVFVHGVCHDAWCWNPFLEFFAARGQHALALSLSGHGASSGHREIHRFGLDHYVCDVLDVVGRLAAPPLLVGHSMGGAVVQRYLAAHGATVAGAVLFASATAGGVGGRKFVDAVRGIGPRTLVNGVRIVRGSPSSAERVNDTPFFGGRLSPTDAAKYAKHLGPESLRAIWDLLKRFPINAAGLPPVMVIGSRNDDLFGERSQRLTARAYGVAPLLLDGLCHDMMLDPDRELPAQHVLDFLKYIT